MVNHVQMVGVLGRRSFLLKTQREEARQVVRPAIKACQFPSVAKENGDRDGINTLLRKVIHSVDGEFRRSGFR